MADLEIKKFRRSLIDSQDIELKRTINGRDFLVLVHLEI